MWTYKATNKSNWHNCVYSYDENNKNINNSSAILGSDAEWEWSQPLFSSSIVTNFRQQSPSWEADSSLASQEILWNQKCHYHVLNNFSQKNPVYKLASPLRSILISFSHLSLCLPSVPFLQVFLPKPVYLSLLPHFCWQYYISEQFLAASAKCNDNQDLAEVSLGRVHGGHLSHYGNIICSYLH